MYFVKDGVDWPPDVVGYGVGVRFFDGVEEVPAVIEEAREVFPEDERLGAEAVLPMDGDLDRAAVYGVFIQV